MPTTKHKSPGQLAREREDNKPYPAEHIFEEDELKQLSQLLELKLSFDARIKKIEANKKGIEESIKELLDEHEGQEGLELFSFDRFRISYKPKKTFDRKKFIGELVDLDVPVSVIRKAEKKATGASRPSLRVTEQKEG